MENKIQFNQKVNPMFEAKKPEEKKEMTMEELIKDVMSRMHDSAQNYVPEYGEFSPVMEFFDNPEPRTQNVVGKYGLRVYKMSKDISPDPKERFLEATAYVPSGMYKSDMTLCAGTKDEILEYLKDPEVAQNLRKVYADLCDIFENYN